MTPLDILIMAAGKGTRMKSRTPKVLQRLAGRPLLHHVLDQAAHLQARSAIVITGHGATEVEAATAGFTGATVSFDLKFVRQEPQLGTGHAVARYVNNSCLRFCCGRYRHFLCDIAALKHRATAWAAAGVACRNTRQCAPAPGC